MKIVPLILAAGVLSLAQTGHARWANTTEPVPVERLVKNLSAFVKENPKDAQGFYTLGRIHSLAFARGSENLDVVPEGKAGQEKLPGFAPWESIQLKPEAVEGKVAEISPAMLMHLTESVRNYSRAVELAPKEPLYFLGLGWMLEQGAPHAWKLAMPWMTELKVPERTPVGDELQARSIVNAWRQKSYVAYKSAYELREKEDLAGGMNGPTQDSLISREAGQGILRYFDTTGAFLAEANRDEIARIKKSIEAMKKLPQVMTPIILPLQGQSSLKGLLDAKKTVSFDLAGDGIAKRWPWVGAQTGILVWDPTNSGIVNSGRQLFGSATWWMLWKNGYDALASLDDNSDGWLRAGETKGLRIWQDANGDGVSQPGEVKSLKEQGIDSLAVRATGKSDGAPSNLQGVKRSDGTFAPSYDWTPTSLAPLN